MYPASGIEISISIWTAVVAMAEWWAGLDPQSRLDAVEAMASGGWYPQSRLDAVVAMATSEWWVGTAVAATVE